MADEFEDDFCPVDEHLDALNRNGNGLEEQKPQFSVVFGSMSNLPQERKNVIRVFLSSTFSGEFFLPEEHISASMMLTYLIYYQLFFFSQKDEINSGCQLQRLYF